MKKIAFTFLIALIIAPMATVFAGCDDKVQNIKFIAPDGFETVSYALGDKLTETMIDEWKIEIAYENGKKSTKNAKLSWVKGPLDNQKVFVNTSNTLYIEYKKATINVPVAILPIRLGDYENTEGHSFTVSKFNAIQDPQVYVISNLKNFTFIFGTSWDNPKQEAGQPGLKYFRFSMEPDGSFFYGENDITDHDQCWNRPYSAASGAKYFADAITFIDGGNSYIFVRKTLVVL